MTQGHRRDRRRLGYDRRGARKRAAGTTASAQQLSRSFHGIQRIPKTDRTEVTGADARKPQDLDRSAVATGDRIEYPVRAVGTK